MTGLSLCLMHFFGGLADLVHYIGGLGHLGGVGDQNDAFALLGQLAEDVQNLVLGLPVQVARGLVGQDDFGVVGQGPGDGHPLLLAAGELQHPAVGLFGAQATFSSSWAAVCFLSS